jgi:NAD(P)-dependent dehydrogenase (short-subunit alcohol dehydrogenase family)
MGRFSDQSFVITGGSSGIGLATARRIVAEGGRVLVTGTNDKRLEAAKALHHNIHTLKSDAADPAAAEVLANEAKHLFGQLSGVFLNAGFGVLSPLGSITLELFRKQFETNVAGVLFGAQALAPLVKRGGTLLLMASGAKTNGMPGSALYAGSKGAVRSITLVLARELAPRGIRVNTISPGPIDTHFHERLNIPPEKLKELEAALQAAIPLGRIGKVEEAVAVATFLLSDEASFVTGADYPVDGGEAQL